MKKLISIILCAALALAALTACGSTAAPTPTAEPVQTAEPTPEPEQSPDLPPLDTPPVILPAELNSDVMSLESSNTGVTSPEAPAVAADALSSSAAGSIQQQYTEQPSTGDQTNTPIFDTSTHVQPLEAPKKKSVLKWVLAVLLLLAIGVAAGVAYFYYTTQ